MIKLALVPICAVAFAACAPAAEPAPAAPAPAAAPAATSAVQAAAGDTVRMFINHVHADRRQQFEQFVLQTLTPTLDRIAATDPQVRQQRQHTRMLQPIQANPDGTYTYIFLLDPPVPGADYTFTTLFRRAGMPEEQATTHIRSFQESLARPQEARTYIVR